MSSTNKGNRKEEECDDEENCPDRTEVFVTRGFCDERFQRVLDKLIGIDTKIDDLKKARDAESKEKQEESHALRNTVLSVIAGGAIALLSWALSRWP
jgi:hypothetical protein